MSILDFNVHNFWTRSQIEQSGDSKADAIYLAVGIALTRWEIVEEAFSGLFGYFVESPAQAATRAYGTVMANAAKIKMMEEAAQIFFRLYQIEDKYSKTLEKLLEHYEYAHGRRSDIAHGVVMGFIKGAENLGSYLVPPRYNSRNTKAFAEPNVGDFFYLRIAKYHYTSLDISMFTGKFNLLQQELLQFWTRLVEIHPQK